MYVRPAFRGQGIGRALVRKLTEEARRAGFERMILDSHISMIKAHGVYETFGFKKVGAPDAFPEEFKSIVVFMECELNADSDPRSGGVGWATGDISKEEEE